MFKYEKVSFDNRHVLIPFMFDTFSFLVLEDVNILQRVQKGLAVQFVTSLSFIFM